MKEGRGEKLRREQGIGETGGERARERGRETKGGREREGACGRRQANAIIQLIIIHVGWCLHSELGEEDCRHWLQWDAQ